jgi:hypothetical protein
VILTLPEEELPELPYFPPPPPTVGTNPPFTALATAGSIITKFFSPFL